MRTSIEMIKYHYSHVTSEDHAALIDGGSDQLFE